MEERFNFLIFSVYNFFYKNGNFRKSDTPNFNTVFVFTLFEMMFLLLGLFLINLILFLLNGPMNQLIPVFGTTAPICIAVFFLNYFFLINNGKVKRLYELYTDQYKAREQKYRKILYVLYGVLPLALILLLGNAKAWFTIHG